MKIIDSGLSFSIKVTKIASISSSNGGEYEGYKYSPKATFTSEVFFEDDDGNEKKYNVSFEIPCDKYDEAMAVRDLLKEIRKNGVSFDFKSFFPSKVSSDSYKYKYFGNFQKYKNYLQNLVNVKK